MNRTQHKPHAMSAGFVTEEIYEKMNAANKAKNRAIRAARAEYNALIDAAAPFSEIDKAGAKVDAAFKL